MYKSKQTSESRKKALFRKTSRWANFKIEMKNRGLGVDRITRKPLNKGWNLHHCDLDPEHYEILNWNNFECLNPATHDFIHWLYNFYKKDPFIIERIEDLMKKMVALNAPKCDSVIITDDYRVLCSNYDYPCPCDNCIKGKKK